jgi:hypothetical protein
MRILMCGTGGAGKENFGRTVARPVDLEAYADFLTFTQRQLLEARHGRFARVWSIPENRQITSELKPGDQVWFHHANYVNHVAQVVTVFRSNPGFDAALWNVREFPASGFIFTVTEPQAAHISKARINELLDYSEKNNWVGNRLLSEEKSKLLTSAVHLTI